MNNLSKGLVRVSSYLQECDEIEASSTEEGLLIREERISGATELINILKSVNDTALSDWGGVIGDEIHEQKLAQEQREEALRSLVARVERVRESAPVMSSAGETEILRRNIAELQEDMARALVELGARRRRTRSGTKADVLEVCPMCGAELRYRQRQRPKSVKIVKCTSCEGRSLSRHVGDGEFEVEPVGTVACVMGCPNCDCEHEVEMENIPGVSQDFECKACGASLRCSYVYDGIRIKAMQQRRSRRQERESEALPEEFIEAVKARLPEQPWPKLINRKVADEMGVSRSRVSRAIAILMKRQEVHPQVDGVVYVPREEREEVYGNGNGARGTEENQ